MDTVRCTMFDSKRSIDLQSIIKEMKLETDFMPRPANEIQIHLADVGRPGLALMGYFEHFEPQRIQIIGNAEYALLEQKSAQNETECVTALLSHHPVAVVFTHGNLPTPHFLELAEYFEVPVLHTGESSGNFMAQTIAYLTLTLAPCITRHGVLVEVYGEGVLMLGDSGVGKSETAIELIKRGHRLIADDAVEIKVTNNGTLMATAPELIRHYMELRGIGVIDVRRLFGMGAIKDEQQIDLVINLENWKENAVYDRLGLDSSTTDILGVEVPCLTIPVKPGRNLASIVEVAAMNNRNRRMGHNAALELSKRMDEHFSKLSLEEE